MKCERCKVQIFEKIEKYVSIADYEKEKKIKEVFLHLRCWKSMFAEGINKALREKVKQVMGLYQ